MRSLASPFRVKWFAALAGGGVSQTEEKVVFKEAHDRALVSSWGAALGPLFLAPHRSLNESQRQSPAEPGYLAQLAWWNWASAAGAPGSE